DPGALGQRAPVRGVVLPDRGDPRLPLLALDDHRDLHLRGDPVRPALAARPGRGDRMRSPRAILIAGWLVFVAYAYPGFMVSESSDMLYDARIGNFTDWHSATMTQLWQLTSWWISGPFGMLVVQSTLFLAGAYHLLRRVLAPRAAAFAAA